MITSEVSEKLKRGIGPDYCKRVQERLEAKGLRTRKGTPYMKGYIIMVMNSDREIPDVEETIFEVYSDSVQQIVEDARTMGVPILEVDN